MVVFAKGASSHWRSWERGLGSSSGGWWGVAFCRKWGERGRVWGGCGVGWGQAKEPASQCEGVCQNYPFSKLPFSFSPISRVRKKGVFWKRGLFRKVHLLETVENLEILEILENRQIVENKGESDHFLEILENLEISEILEILPAKRPLS